ncbi:MAG: helix-turn-helix domain-containing protein, partial [Saprospiraceae bacterium]|nr:helix-turn-helix domain-containing protein [Saprospiraceae bacterium]
MTYSDGDSEFIARLRDVIEANFDRHEFGVRELALKLSISRSQLHRKISATTGLSASAYLNEFRLQKAHSLLQQGSMTASEVAYEVGFSSPSYFSTAFKKYYSFSPTQVKGQGSHAVYTPHWGEEDKQREQFNEHRSNGGGKIFARKGLLFLIGLVGIAVISYFMVENSALESRQAPVIKDKSIAVLPFRNYSNDPSLEAFCDGMTDALISKLSKIADFERVISRTSTYKFKDERVSIPEIASELGVAYILEGNIQKSDGNIRVNAQLIDANRDDHVWTDEYNGDWDSKDIFDIQEKITSFVVNTMQVFLSANESAMVWNTITPSKQAYDLYLQAKFHMYSADQGSTENAKQLLAEAIDLDSTFASAYSELGYIWFTSGLEEGFNH